MGRYWSNSEARKRDIDIFRTVDLLLEGGDAAMAVLLDFGATLEFPTFSLGAGDLTAPDPSGVGWDRDLFVLAVAISTTVLFILVLMIFGVRRRRRWNGPTLF